MDNIIIFSVIFEILTFLVMLTLSRIMYKYIQIEKPKRINLKSKKLKRKNNNENENKYKQDFMLTILFICFLLSSIAGLIKCNMILFIIVIFLLITLNVYAFIKNDYYLSSFIIIYGVFNIIMSILGIIITFNSDNIFFAYIITIALSPLSYSKNISFIFIIIISVIMLTSSIYNIMYKDIKDNKIVK